LWPLILKSDPVKFGDHCCFQHGFQTDVLLHFKTMVPQRTNFALFLPAVEIRGEVCKLKRRSVIAMAGESFRFLISFCFETREHQMRLVSTEAKLCIFEVVNPKKFSGAGRMGKISRFNFSSSTKDQTSDTLMLRCHCMTLARVCLMK